MLCWFDMDVVFDHKLWGENRNTVTELRYTGKAKRPATSVLWQYSLDATWLLFA